MYPKSAIFLYFKALILRQRVSSSIFSLQSTWKTLYELCAFSVRMCIPSEDVHYRVSSDLENLEMSGNFDARRKSQGIFKKQEKSGNFAV